jgi:putative membrane protein
MRMKSMDDGVHRRVCRDWLHYANVKNVQVPVLPFLSIALYATLVTVLHKCSLTYQHHDESAWAFHELTLDSSTNTYLALSLMLLLTMRATQSYNRWWEGRSKWGQIVNRTRDLAGQAKHWLHDDEISSCILRHLVGFAYATKRHLRMETGLPELWDEDHVPVEVRLRDHEIEAAEMAESMPLHMLSVIREYVRQAAAAKNISDMQVLAMDQNITDFNDSLGGCEKILKTPFPASYVSHLRTFTLLYLVLFPFTQLETHGWLTIFITWSVSCALMGMEHMSSKIEQPFIHSSNALKLDAICAGIHKSIAQISQFSKAGLTAGEPLDP